MCVGRPTLCSVGRRAPVGDVRCVHLALPARDAGEALRSAPADVRRPRPRPRRRPGLVAGAVGRRRAGLGGRRVRPTGG